MTGTPRNKSRVRWALAAAAAATILLAACGGGDDDGGGGGGDGGGDYANLSGEIVADGSSTVGPITEAMAEEFGKVSDVRVSVGVSGTGGGFERFCQGETDINDASRPIKKDDDKEGKACAANGVDYVEFKVGIDGLTVVVNPDIDFAECLSFSQLKALWDQGSEIDNWNEVDPSFPDRGIKLYGPGPDSGTFDYFTEEVNGKTDQSRSDYTASEDDNVLVQGVENDRGALGYFGYAYYQGEGSRLSAVAIKKDQNGKGTPVADGQCVAPTAESINDGSYPLARPLYIYVSKEALAKPHVRGFVEFYLTSPDLVADVGYIALPDDEYQQGLDALDAN